MPPALPAQPVLLKTCVRCGGQIFVRRNGRFCSRACFLKPAEMPARDCGFCGRPLVPYGRQGAKGFATRRYCNAACQAGGSRRHKPTPPGALDRARALLTGLPFLPLINTDAVTIVDSDVLVWALAINWCLSTEGYAKASSGEGAGQYLHRLILGAKPGELVDHASAQQLDNRRENLRFAEKVQNQQNQHRTRNHRVGFKGVWPVTARSWCAYITVRKVRMYLGCFGSPENAASAYDRAAIEHFGPFARLNFSDDPARSAIRPTGAQA